MANPSPAGTGQRTAHRKPLIGLTADGWRRLGLGGSLQTG